MYSAQQEEDIIAAALAVVKAADDYGLKPPQGAGNLGRLEASIFKLKEVLTLSYDNTQATSVYLMGSEDDLREGPWHNRVLDLVSQKIAEWEEKGRTVVGIRLHPAIAGLLWDTEGKIDVVGRACGLPVRLFTDPFSVLDAFAIEHVGSPPQPTADVFDMLG